MKVHMPHLNKNLLSGRLVRDPELYTTKTEKKVTHFTLAVNKVYKDKDGNRKETTSFIPVVAWNGAAEAICRNLKQGSGIIVDGETTSRQYTTKDGSKRTAIEVHARRTEFLTSEDKVVEHLTEGEAPEEAPTDESAV